MENNGQNMNYGYNMEQNMNYNYNNIQNQNGYVAVAEQTAVPNYHYQNCRVGFELVKSFVFTESTEEII